MAMDGLNLYASVLEVAALTGGRIEKIQQPGKDELVLTIHAAEGTRRVLLCASASRCGVQITQAKRTNPLDAPMFCMLLRKHLTGGRVLSVEQPNLDRTVLFRIEARNELGDTVPFTLIAEMMGKYSNVILVNDKNIVLDAIRHVGPSMSAVRIVLPGMAYEPAPTQDKRDPREASVAVFREALQGIGRVDKTLSATFYGLSPSMASALAQRATDVQNLDSLSEKEAGALAESLHAFYQDLSRGQCQPAMLLNTFDEPVAVYPFAPASGNVRLMPSMAEAMDAFYADLDVREHMRRRGQAVRRILQNNVERCEKKLSLYTQAIEADEKIEQYRLYGELITASLFSLGQNADEAVVMNYYLDPPQQVKVAMDRRFTPGENAQRYYRSYQKARAAKDMAFEQRKQTLEELGYLEGQLDNLDKCTTDQEFEELEQELRALGYMRAEKTKGKPRKAPPASKPMHLLSSDGTDIYVGKNNAQNDRLTLRFASENDIWLHTKDIPGSHVIIASDSPSDTTLFEAAMLAAWYSKGRGGANVAVDYTPRRYVKKPSGAKPGMVIYAQNRTAYVTPDEATVKRLQQLS